MGRIKSYDHLIGQTFTNLYVNNTFFKNHTTMLDCTCKCGKKVEAVPYQVLNGSVKSCGCYSISLLNEYNRTHSHTPPNKIDGRGSHPLYGLWRMMLSRCENPQNNMYKHYGGRGIKVCDEWHDFWKFVKWSDSVGGRPKGYTLDRIDVNGDYEPNNCRWADAKVQNRNTSRNIYITYNGKTQVLKDWANELGIPVKTLSYRYEKGFPLEDVFSTEKYTKFPRHKILNCYSKDGNLINSYNSFSELPTNYNHRMVTQSIYRGTTYSKMYWKYEDK